MPVEVRVATLADVPSIGEVHVRAWQAAYRGVMPDEYLDGLLIEERSAMWAARLARGDPSLTTIVVTDDEIVVGFAAVGPARGLEPPDIGGELYAINLHPARWRHGLGSRLLDASTSALTDLGHKTAILWVVRENDRARRFYERHGWSPDGEEEGDNFAGTTITEVRYRRFLAD